MFYDILDVCSNKRIVRIGDLEPRIGSRMEAILQIPALRSAGVTLTHPPCPQPWGRQQENGKTCSHDPPPAHPAPGTRYCSFAQSKAERCRKCQCADADVLSLNSVLDVVGQKCPKRGAWSVFANRQTTSVIREVT